MVRWYPVCVYTTSRSEFDSNSYVLDDAADITVCILDDTTVSCLTLQSKEEAAASGALSPAPAIASLRGFQLPGAEERSLRFRSSDSFSSTGNRPSNLGQVGVTCSDSLDPVSHADVCFVLTALASSWLGQAAYCNEPACPQAQSPRVCQGQLTSPDH